MMMVVSFRIPRARPWTNKKIPIKNSKKIPKNPPKKLCKKMVHVVFCPIVKGVSVGSTV